MPPVVPCVASDGDVMEPVSEETRRRLYRLGLPAVFLGLAALIIAEARLRFGPPGMERSTLTAGLFWVAVMAGAYLAVVPFVAWRRSVGAVAVALWILAITYAEGRRFSAFSIPAFLGYPFYLATAAASLVEKEIRTARRRRSD